MILLFITPRRTALQSDPPWVQVVTETYYPTIGHKGLGRAVTIRRELRLFEPLRPQLLQVAVIRVGRHRLHPNDRLHLSNQREVPTV